MFVRKTVKWISYTFSAAVAAARWKRKEIMMIFLVRGLFVHGIGEAIKWHNEEERDLWKTDVKTCLLTPSFIDLSLFYIIFLLLPISFRYRGYDAWRMEMNNIAQDRRKGNNRQWLMMCIMCVQQFFIFSYRAIKFSAIWYSRKFIGELKNSWNVDCDSNVYNFSSCDHSPLSERRWAYFSSLDHPQNRAHSWNCVVVLWGTRKKMLSMSMSKNAKKKLNMT